MTALATRMLDPCLVCGDKSIGFNFGVLSCMACKAFFRRNAVKLGVRLVSERRFSLVFAGLFSDL